MSSVPVQFLINVLPIPQCPALPVFEPITDCSEVQVNVETTFEFFVDNQCDPDLSILTDIVLTTSLPGLKPGNFTLTDDQLYAYLPVTWTPQDNQIGQQDICAIAFTRYVFFHCRRRFVVSEYFEVNGFSLTNIV